MERILKYFPKLSETQKKQYAMLGPLYEDWNAKINVVSRKDIDNLYLHHILHSLSIAKEITFRAGSTVLDVGTGGGFPGIPLAIMFPECRFKLIDRTGKKILVVNEIVKACRLNNVVAEQLPAEEERGKYDFVVSRAVMTIPDLVRVVKKNISRKNNNARANGLICLKGGNLEGEVRPFKKIAEIVALTNYFDEEWFKEKNIVYVPI